MNIQLHIEVRGRVIQKISCDLSLVKEIAKRIMHTYALKENIEVCYY